MAEIALLVGSMASAAGSAATTIAPIAALAGTGLSFAGQQAAAKQSKQLANIQAKEQERQGQQELVAANRRAIEERRRGERVLSRARAAGAKTGTDGGDLANIYGSIAGRAEVAPLSQVRAGQSAYESAKSSASATRYEGAAKASQIKMSSYADLIGGLGDVFSHKIKKA